MIVRPLAPIRPVDAAARLRGLGRLTWLDSAMTTADLGRYSFLAVDPFASLTVRDGVLIWNGTPVAPTSDDRPGRHALAFLRQQLQAFPVERRTDLPPFQGGAAGYLAYEFGQLLEDLPRAAATGIAEAALQFYDLVLSWDHARGEAWLVSTGWPEREATARQVRAEARAEAILSQLAVAVPGPAPGAGTVALAWRTNLGAAGFEAAVRRTIAHILAGDIFQANIAERHVAALPDDFDAFAFYCRLRRLNPAPFAAWLDHGPLKVACSSPERFLKLVDGHVETRPIKGTIRRSADSEDDARLAAALLASDKDRAENVMIVDLMRSDLSRVCRPHTVAVPVLAGLESYETVHHLVSVVTGELEAGCDGLDLIAATFPGGSITGAPKIRAMAIIAEQEGVERGVYCGAIGYFGFEGSADFNIAIRTVTFAGGEAVVAAGCGITALSDPAAERREAAVKAARLFAAFEPEAPA